MRYFDISEGLPAQYLEILNLKVRDIKDHYEKTLVLLADANEEMNRRVIVLDKINCNNELLLILKYRGRN